MTREEESIIVQEKGGRAGTQGREENGITQEKGGKEIDRRRETALEKGGEMQIVQETIVPGEERKGDQERERTVGKETMAESTDPIIGTGAAASPLRGVVRGVGVPGGHTVDTTGDDTAARFT